MVQKSLIAALNCVICPYCTLQCIEDLCHYRQLILSCKVGLKKVSNRLLQNFGFGQMQPKRIIKRKLNNYIKPGILHRFKFSPLKQNSPSIKCHVFRHSNSYDSWS